MTEKAAWSLARDKELDMVVINLAIVLDSKVFGTTQCIFSYLKGVKELPQSGLFVYAHLEDVAESHVAALGSPEAPGRYICYERVISEEKLVELICKLYLDSSIPSMYMIILSRSRLMACKSY